MRLTGLHLLLTYQCTLECDHCFVYGSPWQNGVMTINDVRRILQTARELGSVKSIYFEGGEPLLYYATLVRAVEEAWRMDFSVGIVSNGYWATSYEDALLSLEPFAGRIEDLSVSTDLYHYSEAISLQSKHAQAAAEKLNIPVGTIEIAQPVDKNAPSSIGQLPPGGSAVMYRGRAADKLASKAIHAPWDSFTTCPYENLVEPGRLHVDPFGNLFVCQGIVIGNMFREPLGEIVQRYDPASHPIVAPLLAGGPAELVRRYGLPHDEQYADACHECDRMRRLLRLRFPDILAPDEVYGLTLN